MYHEATRECRKVARVNLYCQGVPPRERQIALSVDNEIRPRDAGITAETSVQLSGNARLLRLLRSRRYARAEAGDHPWQHRQCPNCRRSMARGGRRDRANAVSYTPGGVEDALRVIAAGDGDVSAVSKRYGVEIVGPPLIGA
jgi:hypothetical protein